MSSGYVTLSRQSGLMREMQTIANNVANMSTTGFRREGVVFSEYIKAGDGGGEAVSIAAARGRHLDLTQGTLQPTGATFDLAIQGEGFFLVETSRGERLTRAGHFLPSDTGDLVTPDGHRVLDEGGAPIFVPPDAGGIAVATDGTISADGRPLAKVGIVLPSDAGGLERVGDTLLAAPTGWEPVPAPRVMQGFLEGSNVNPVTEIARMIEVQRAYELGQTFSEREGKRLSSLIDMLSS